MSAWPFGANRPDPTRPSIFMPPLNKTGKPHGKTGPKPQPQEGSRLTLPGSLAPRRMA